MRRKDELGDTLIEIIVAIVIIGALVGALLASYATVSLGTKAQRDLVTADAVLRDYAEQTKAAVRTTCEIQPTYTVAFTPPPSFTVQPTAGPQRACPASPTTTRDVALSVTLPNGRTTRTMSIRIRTP